MSAPGLHRKHRICSAWVTGYGTGGTLKGVARVLAKKRPETKIVVCEPTDAQLLASGIAQSRNSDGTPAAPHPTFKHTRCKGGRRISSPNLPMMPSQ
jgi:cysteine synthase